MAGEPLSDSALAAILPQASGLQGPSAVHLATSTSAVVPLSTSAGPLGLIALQGADLHGYDETLVQTYANQAALALERAQLREQAIRTQLLEQVDRWRDALVGAVSHDLRTPLAVIKAAVSDLLAEEITLETSARDELLHLIEEQSDRLARLVVNLLDMTRIRAGALTPRLERQSVDDLVVEALAALPQEIRGRTEIRFESPGPLVVGDRVLISRVLANLLENADRHGPPGTPIEIDAAISGGLVEVSVTDHGPGVASDERERIFDMYSHVSGAGRAGLGLAIARAFVEAHGGAISVANVLEGGARFSFTLQSGERTSDVS
jgi:two-component system sensor histidine kinase KdpD